MDKNNDTNQSELINPKSNKRNTIFWIVLIGVMTLVAVLVILLSYKKEASNAELVESENITQEGNTNNNTPSKSELTDTSQPDSEKIESETVEMESEISENEVLETEVEESETGGEFDFLKYDSFDKLLNDMPYDELKIIVWNYENNAQAILSSGDSYQVQEGDYLFLYYPQENLTVNTYKDYVIILNEYEKDCGFCISVAGENLETTFIAMAQDGKEYEITVYLSKDFEW